MKEIGADHEGNIIVKMGRGEFEAIRALSRLAGEPADKRHRVGFDYWALDAEMKDWLDAVYKFVSISEIADDLVVAAESLRGTIRGEDAADD